MPCMTNTRGTSQKITRKSDTGGYEVSAQNQPRLSILAAVRVLTIRLTASMAVPKHHSLGANVTNEGQTRVRPADDTDLADDPNCSHRGP